MQYTTFVYTLSFINYLITYSWSQCGISYVGFCSDCSEVYTFSTRFCINKDWHLITTNNTYSLFSSINAMLAVVMLNDLVLFLWLLWTSLCLKPNKLLYSYLFFYLYTFGMSFFYTIQHQFLYKLYIEHMFLYVHNL